MSPNIPYTLIQRLLSQNKSEVLITVMVESINRWLELRNDVIRSHIVDTFGTEEAISVADGTGVRVTALKDLYHRQLDKAAKFVRYFEMRNRQDRVVYYLFFASNNAKGHLKMKEAMWKVDPKGDFRFSDATVPEQSLLYDAPSNDLLANALMEKFGSAAQTLIEDIETFVSDETAYLPKHMREVFQEMENRGTLEVKAKKKDGTKRRANSFPNEAFVTFIANPYPRTLFDA